MSGGNTSIPNYRDTSFEYANLTQIHGEPTYETLTALFNHLKANTCSVQTSLGGGQHGYLGLVLSPAQYNTITPNNPFTYPAHQCMWDAFQTHFSQAHREIRESGELEIRDTPFNTANIVQEVIEGVQQVLQPAMEASYEAEAANNLQYVAPAESTQQTVLMEQMLQMMQLMQQQMQQSSSSQSNNKSNKIRTKTDKYCWTHGGCAHTSKNCRNKKPGHQDDAMFENRMGGSTAYINQNNWLFGPIWNKKLL